jgi:hypothetical protein
VLQEKQSQLTDFMENATVGLQWLAPDGTVLWANKARPTCSAIAWKNTWDGTSGSFTSLAPASIPSPRSGRQGAAEEFRDTIALEGWFGAARSSGCRRILA